MTDSTADATIFAKMRFNMVESQVRPNQVNDARVIEAMRTLPREKFAPAGSKPYADADIDLGGGRFLLAPMLIARLTQMVLSETPAKILVVAAGAGYGAAILALAGAQVIALEPETRLDTGALQANAPAVKQVTRKLADGYKDGAPYDAILIEGAVLDIPAAFATQLAPGGRVITILAESRTKAGLGRAVVAESRGQGFAIARIFDCTARILPEFMPAPAFVF